MNPIAQTIILSASTVRLIPHIILYMTKRKTVDADLTKVQDCKPTVMNFIKAMTREDVPQPFLLPDGRISLSICQMAVPSGTHSQHLVSEYRTRSPLRTQLCHIPQRRVDRQGLLLPSPRNAWQRQRRTPHNRRQRQDNDRRDGIRRHTYRR